MEIFGREERVMKNLLNVVALLVLVAGGFMIYQKFMSGTTIDVVDSITHELSATEEFVFSRDKMHFSQTQHNAAGLAHIDYLYTWDASVPFGFKTSDLKLDYDKKTKLLKVTVNNLRLFRLTIENQKDKVTSEFAWMDRGMPAQKFWKKVNKETQGLVDHEYTRDASQVASAINISRNSLTTTLVKILGKLHLSDIKLEVDIHSLRLYNGRVVRP